MLKKLGVFFLAFVLSFSDSGPLLENNLKAQNASETTSSEATGPVSNFDQQTVADWIAQVQGREPELFSATLCINQGFMEQQIERSCLLEQSLFLLKDINVRRQATEAGLRQILEQSEAQRVALSQHLDAQELEGKESANRIAEQASALANALRRIEQLENEQRATDTELAILQRKHNGLKTSEVASLRTVKATLIKNAQLKSANQSLRNAYKDLANRLASGVAATSN